MMNDGKIELFLLALTFTLITASCSRAYDGACAVNVRFDEEGREVCRTFRNYSGDAVCPENFSYAMLKIDYDENGEIHSLGYFDTDGEPAESRGWCSVIFNREDSGRRVERTFLDVNGDPVEGLSYATFEVIYDEFGLELSRSFKNAEGQYIDYNGFARTVSDYSEEGSLLETVYLNAEGSPVVNPYNGFSRILCEYYGDGILTGKSWFDEQGRPAYPDEMGYAALRHRYDSIGYRIESSFHDESGALISPDFLGYAMIRWQYDPDGNNTFVQYLGEDSLPIAPAARSYCAIEREYDSHGREIARTFLNEEGDPDSIGFEDIPDRRFYFQGDAFSQTANNNEYYSDRYSGHSMARVQYDDAGNMVRIERFDWNGKPSELDGVSRVDFVRNDEGKLLEISFQDAIGNPSIPAMLPMAPRIVFEYDEQGRVAAVELMDGEGALVEETCGVSFSSMKIERDDSGSDVTWTFFDSEGNPVSPMGFWLLGLPSDIEYEDVVPELFIYSVEDFLRVCPPPVLSNIVF